MDGKLKEAVAMFNRGDYFEASDRFEAIVGETEAETRALVTALMRIAAALHLRFERGGRQGAINLLSQAALELEDLRPAHAGIDVARLFDEIRAFTEDVRGAPREETHGIRHSARLFVERRRAPRIQST